MSVGIEPNLEMEAEENQFIKIFIQSFLNRLSINPAFNPNTLDDVKFLLVKSIQPFSRYDVIKILNDGEPLTLVEKKELGLNTRLKINRNYLKYINLGFIDKSRPFDFLKEIEFYSRARGWSEREISRAKRMKFSLKLYIDKDTCPESMPFIGNYSTSNAPLLPLISCGKKCLCFYQIDVKW
ncbi:hypothetical protein [Acinetobacter wanghuae]|uniref:hypothetical protein n=1 Tax=Acinetobacter wanghuae TaxID=2662362 RepID=UPI003AF8CB2A